MMGHQPHGGGVTNGLPTPSSSFVEVGGVGPRWPRGDQIGPRGAAPDDVVRFPVEGNDGASLSMLSVVLG
jgi:hypothetical protein